MLGLRKIRRTYNKYFMRKPKTQKALLALLVYGVLVLFIAMSVLPQQLDVRMGEESPKTVVASRDIIDRIATQQEVENAVRNVPDAYVRDQNIEEQVIRDVQDIFNAAEVVRTELRTELRTDENNQGDEAVAKLASLLDESLRQRLTEVQISSLEYLLTVPEENLAQLENDIDVVLKQTFAEGVMSINSGIALIQHYVNAMDKPLQERTFIERIATGVFLPNQSKDQETTEALRQAARDNVPPVYVRRGEIIIQQGQIVTERSYQLLEQLGMLSPNPHYGIYLGTALYVLLVLVILTSYLVVFEQKIFNDISSLVLLALILIITVVISRFAMLVSGFLVPVSVAAILTAILLSGPVAIITSLLLSFLLVLFANGSIEFAIVALAGSFTAIIGVARMRQRADLLRTGVYISMVNGLTILAFNLMASATWATILRESTLGIIGGLLSSVLAIGSLEYFANAFGIVTVVKLLELSNPNQSLLRRLLTEAPGTYHHSILVGNLAEAAAEEVAADPLLARVGAYYHDIGKTKRPYFFIENQFTAENPHDKYTPSLSTLIITSHVKDGVEMAREAKLPQKVIDIVEQHHGTTTVQYFYHKAQEKDKENLREEDFQYDGPKPQTKEAAIVMLADSVEAAVRSQNRPTPGKVEGLVRKIIKERLNNGELDESDLTLKDLDRLAAAFVHILTGIFHNRIEYPERSIADLERSRRLSGGTNK